MKKLLLLFVALVATSAAWAQDTYVVAGVSALCGSNWSATDANNQMTLQADGTYVKAYANVATGDYQFKVVKNGSEWIGDKTGQNVQFTVSTACDVNIYFNPTNNDITVAGDGVGEKSFEINKVVAVGNGSGNWLNNVNWDPAASANEMTQVGDLVYEISYNDVPVGSDYQVKFALNGSWADNFGGTYAGNGVEGDADYNGGNIYVNVEKAGTVTLRLDLSSFDYNSKSGAKVTITSPKVDEPVEEAFFLKHPWNGGEWTWKPLTKGENGKWSLEEAYGNNGCNWNTKASNDGSTWVAEPTVVGQPAVGDKCTFTFDPATGSITITKVTPTGINDININSAKVVKTIENGQVVILKGGKKFNVAGQMVK